MADMDTPKDYADALTRLITAGIPSDLPPMPRFDPTIDRAPRRPCDLSGEDRELAVRNALRYFPLNVHGTLGPELEQELAEYGHIYMYRYCPPFPLKAISIDLLPHRSKHAATVMFMILNNLDPTVAQHPYELVTYGGNGSVFQNWAQFRLTMRLLSEMSDDQTLALYSGHPLGLFPSSTDAPRAVVTNGMMVPNFSDRETFARLNAIGVTQYGQMTAGSFMYIGPQGIVHGTTITALNAGRLRDPGRAALQGMLFVSSGLGGMSGAQPKAGSIAGAVTVVAEVNERAARKRLEQGWVHELHDDLGELTARAIRAKRADEAVALAYLGNVVDLWEHLAREGIEVDLGSDQTSLHNPYGGGYYPADLSFDAARAMMVTEPDRFREAVHLSLRRQVAAINTLAERGMYFFDYGNAFLLEASRAGADVLEPGGDFRYPSYIQDIVGPLCFDYGFGPFRWVCVSNDPADLAATDAIAAETLHEHLVGAPDSTRYQLQDNLRWICSAVENRLVVGSQARILYADALGRVEIAERFNAAIASGRIRGPIVIGRDHHDVSGADSPYRETSDIEDGSNLTADMSVHTFVGNAFRGATWVSLHNGGGVGWGLALNCGFGLVLDGTSEALEGARSMLWWDVVNGLTRRAWAGNANARETIERLMRIDPHLKVTLPVVR